MEKIKYFFDFLSPYSYLSWHWVRKSGYDFDYYPVVLSRVIHQHETKGPAEITPKRNYLFKDCLRYAHQNHIPFEIPGKLPFNSLTALRVALAEVSGEKQKRVIDAIFTASWGKGLEIEGEESLKAILDQNDLNGSELLVKASSSEARKSLKANQKLAIKYDLFGLPTFIAQNELFWGNDSTIHLERFIEGTDFYNKETLQRFFEIGNFGEE